MRNYRRAVIREKMRGTLPFLAGDELSDACAERDSADIVVAQESSEVRRDVDLLELVSDVEMSVAEFQELVALAASSRATCFWSATDRKTFHSPWPNSSHTTGALNNLLQAMVPSFSPRKP